MMAQNKPHIWTTEELRARRKRAGVVAILLVCFVVLSFVVSLVRLGGGA